MNLSADKLKKLRQHCGWSQERLAEISGLSLRTVQRIENGDNASYESQLALATAFNISPGELLSDKEQKVGDGGINWSGILGLGLVISVIWLQLALPSSFLFDPISLLIIVVLPLAMLSIALGIQQALQVIMSLRWVLVLPNQQVGLHQYIPSINKFIFYCHFAGAISSLLGIIAVFMTPESAAIEQEWKAKYPFAMGVGIALLTWLYAALFAELIMRPLKHRIENTLIHNLTNSHSNHS